MTHRPDVPSGNWLYDGQRRIRLDDQHLTPEEVARNLPSRVLRGAIAAGATDFATVNAPSVLRSCAVELDAREGRTASRARAFQTGAQVGAARRWCGEPLTNYGGTS